MSVASLLLLMGLSGWNRTELLLGAAFALAALVLSVYVAHRRCRDRRTLRLALLGITLFYLANAALAALTAPIYAIVALGAAVVPAAALALVLALLGVFSEEEERNLSHGGRA
jgi:peptidoglycan/LPS O-acetylase OafA/YrhL